MKEIGLMALALFCFFFAGAQETAPKKVKVYKTWIKQNDNPEVAKGILYEIGDSSIFLSESVYSSIRQEYRFSDIHLLKVRRVNSVGRGALTGGLIGLGGGILIGATTAADAGIFTSMISAYLGLTYGMLGAGIGVLAGTIKDRYPMKSNLVNFEKYRGNLQDYSYKQEKKAAGIKFEHRGSIGFSMGLSRAMIEFATEVPIDNYQGMNRTGFSSKTNLGYRFSDHLGINFSVRSNQYNLVGENEISMYWNVDAFTIGPVLSMPLAERFQFDFIPSMGYVSAYLMEHEKEVYTGEGLGFNLTGALVYQLSKRWIASASVGYLSSKQEFQEGGSGTARDIDMELGLAYQFGKRSL